mgnify:CR=1 FL=1
MSNDTYWQGIETALRDIATQLGVGASGSLPQHPNSLFHVEHSPDSRQDSPLPAPVGYGVDMNGDTDVPRETSFPQPPVDNLFHVEHSQESSLIPALGYSAVINQKEKAMTVQEALNELIEALTAQVLASVKAEVEDLIGDAISDHNSDYDHDEYAQRDDIRDIVEELLAGATISI